MRGSLEDRDKGRRRGEFWFYFLVFAYASVFFLPHFIFSRTTLLPSYQDESQWLLYHLFMNRVYGQGRFPLWIPELYCGMPFIAWSHAAGLYPFSFLFAVFEYGKAVWVNQWVHGVIFSLGLFALCRKAGASRFSSFAGVMMGAAHFIFGSAGNFMPNLRTGAFGPWFLLFGAGLVLERRAAYFLGFVLVNFLMFLGGQVELIGLGYELSAVMLLAGGWFFRNRAGDVLKGYLLFGAAFVSGYLLSQVQALPTLELTEFSIRGEGLTYNYFKIWSSAPVVNLTVWVPYLANGLVTVALIAALVKARRHPAVFVSVAGIVYCALCLFNPFDFLRALYHLPVVRGLLAHSRIAAWFHILAVLLLALGLDFVFHGSKSFRWIWAGGFFCVIAGAAFFVFREPVAGVLGAGAEPTMKEVVDRLRFWLSPAAGAMAALGLVMAAGAWAPALRKERLLKSLALLLFAAVYALPLGMAMPRNRGDRFRHPREYLEFFKSRPGLFRTQTVYSWAHWEQVSIPLQSGVLGGTYALDGFITVSVDRYTRFLNLLVPGTFREEDGKIADLEATRVLKEGVFLSDWNLPWFSFLGLRWLAAEQRNLKFADHYYLAWPDSPLVGPGRVSAGREPESLRSFIDFRAPVSQAAGLFYLEGDETLKLEIEDVREPGWWIVAAAPNKRDPGLIFARVISRPGWEGAVQGGWPRGESRMSIAAVALKNEGGGNAVRGDGSLGRLVEPVLIKPRGALKQVFSGPGFVIFENPSAGPRAFLAERVYGVSREEGLSRMVEQVRDPLREVAVEDAPARVLSQGPLVGGEGVRVISYEPDRLEMESASRAERLLVLADVYYPGWRAFVDGREERIYPVDYAFRGVMVEPGIHRVEMVYEPASFRLGLFISVAGLGFWSVILISGILFPSSARSEDGRAGP